MGRIVAWRTLVAQKIILDVDPGHDDAMAILLASASPAIDLLAITTVAGNQTLPKTTLNARRVCSRAGITTVPIAAGCDRPLSRSQTVAPTIHGDSGLEGPVFSGEPDVPLDPRHAVDLLIELLMASDGDIMVVPVGPLTNIAMAMRHEPRILPKIKHIALMGGAWGIGNMTPAAEFNMMVDPEAARIVFESGVPIMMSPLELTHQAQATPAVIKRFADIGSPLGDFAVEMLTFFSSTYQREFGIDAPLHDPTAVAWVIDPAIVKTKFVHVDIDVASETSFGRTNIDLYDQLHLEPNAHVGVELDVERFWDLMVSAVASYGD
jgi:ribosylpyrimidine nucleosidase